MCFLNGQNNRCYDFDGAKITSRFLTTYYHQYSSLAAFGNEFLMIGGNAYSSGNYNHRRTVEGFEQTNASGTLRTRTSHPLEFSHGGAISVPNGVITVGAYSSTYRKRVYLYTGSWTYLGELLYATTYQTLFAKGTTIYSFGARFCHYNICK